MNNQYDDVVLKNYPKPQMDCSKIPVPLADETMQERKEKVLLAMKEKGLDTLVVYADIEHGTNYEYIVGYSPRFEEALLVLHCDGSAHLIMGNENLNKVSKARIKAEAIHCSFLSLPHQPMQKETLKEILMQANISGKVGLVGWKLFTSPSENNDYLYDVPYFLVDTIMQICGKENLINATDIFIGENGVRLTNNANEIAHYEFYSALASDAMLEALDSLKPGVSEMEIGGILNKYGQRNSLVTIAAFGERFIKGNMFPTERQLKEGDSISLTICYRGGSNCRSGIALSDENLSEHDQDYFNKLVKPYFSAIRTWLEEVHVGLNAGQLYKRMEEVLPKDQFNWTLNPGHLTAEEEWLAAPVYEESKEILKSGMIFQTDIIPSIEGFCGIGVESTCALADDNLKKEIKSNYPDLWKRIQKRREYIINNIGININEDILPLCSDLAYMKPFMLSKKATAIKKKN